MLTLTQFVEFVKQFGVAGLVFGLVVLLAVYVLEYTDLLPSGDARRVAAAVLSALFGLSAGSAGADAVVSTIAVVCATLAHTLIDAALAWLRAHQTVG